MVLKRLFVGNLPEQVSNDEVAQKFSHFGTVQDAEVKVKNEATFAFVSLDVEAEGKIKQCIEVLNNTKWRGSLIKVQLAKESFLDRLKREQLENQEKSARAAKEVSIISFVDETQYTPKNFYNLNYYDEIGKNDGTRKVLLPHLAAKRKQQVGGGGGESAADASSSHNQNPTKIIKMQDSTLHSNNINNNNNNKVDGVKLSPAKAGNLSQNNNKNNNNIMGGSGSDTDSSDDDDGNEKTSSGLPPFRGLSAYYPEINQSQVSSVPVNPVVTNNNKPSPKLLAPPQPPQQQQQQQQQQLSIQERVARRYEEMKKNEKPTTIIPFKMLQKPSPEKNHEFVPPTAVPPSSTVDLPNKTNPLNFKKRNSDLLRQKSLEARLNLNKNRSAIIKSSLLNIKPPVNADPVNEGSNEKKKKKTLFDDDEDNDEEAEPVASSFKVRPQFEGESGQKNFELSSKFAAYDSRFVIDERFRDADNDNQDGDNSGNKDEDLNDEKLASFNILSQVLGTTVVPKPKAANKSSVIIKRYDPENEEEEEEKDEDKDDLSRKTKSSKNTTSKKDKDSQKREKEETEKTKDEPPPKATYHVAANLKDLFSSSATGSSFSLLQTFGAGSESLRRNVNEDLDNNYDNATSSSTAKKKSVNGENSFWKNQNNYNPFQYDSSDSEQEEVDNKTFAKRVTEKSANDSTPKGQEQEQKQMQKLQRKERFFFAKKDVRFNGVTDFFLTSTENMDDVLYRFNNGERSELKLICKGKIKNTKRKSEKRMETLKRLKRKQKEKRRKKFTFEGSNAVPIGGGGSK